MAAPPAKIFGFNFFSSTKLSRSISESRFNFCFTFVQSGANVIKLFCYFVMARLRGVYTGDSVDEKFQLKSRHRSLVMRFYLNFFLSFQTVDVANFIACVNTTLLTAGTNKLECLSLTSFFRLV